MGGTVSTEVDWTDAKDINLVKKTDEKERESEYAFTSEWSRHDIDPAVAKSLCPMTETEATKLKFPDWRALASEVRTTPDGYTLLRFDPGAVIFKGTGLYMQVNPPKRGFYGTFDVAVTYAFRNAGFAYAGEAGRIVAYRVRKPIYLLDMNRRNLIKLEKDSRLPEDVRDVMSLAFRFNREHFPESERWALQRSSDFNNDLVISKWLCSERTPSTATMSSSTVDKLPHVDGYGYLYAKKFHSEIMLCSSGTRSLELIPDHEWRFHQAFPDCLVDIDPRTGVPHRLISSKLFGGVNRNRVRGTVPIDDKFTRYMNTLYTTGKIPEWLSTCSVCYPSNFKEYDYTSANVWSPVKRQKEATPSSYSSRSENIHFRTWYPTFSTTPYNRPVPPATVTEEEEEEGNVGSNTAAAGQKRTRSYKTALTKPVKGGRGNLNITHNTLEATRIIGAINAEFERLYVPSLTVGIQKEQLIELYKGFASVTHVAEMKIDNVIPWRNAKVIPVDQQWRIATWNLHQSPTNKRGPSAAIMETIRRIDADILCLQEVLNYGAALNTAYASQEFGKMGYVHQHFASVSGSADRGVGYFGTLFLSRVPILEAFVVDLPQRKISDPQRQVLFTKVGHEVNLGNIATHQQRAIWFISTHLDAYDRTGQTRHMQIQEVLDVIKDEIDDNDVKKTTVPEEEAEGKEEKVPLSSATSFLAATEKKSQQVPIVWLGDFNAVRKQDSSPKQWEWIVNNSLTRPPYVAPDVEALKIILQQDTGFLDVSDLTQQRYGFTTWAANRVDYIFLRNLQVLQWFPVLTSLSDHLPLVADILVRD